MKLFLITFSIFLFLGNLAQAREWREIKELNYKVEPEKMGREQAVYAVYVEKARKANLPWSTETDLSHLLEKSSERLVFAKIAFTLEVDISKFIDSSFDQKHALEIGFPNTSFSVGKNGKFNGFAKLPFTLGLLPDSLTAEFTVKKVIVGAGTELDKNLGSPDVILDLYGEHYNAVSTGASFSTRFYQQGPGKTLVVVYSFMDLKESLVSLVPFFIDTRDLIMGQFRQETDVFINTLGKF